MDKIKILVSAAAFLIALLAFIAVMASNAPKEVYRPAGYVMTYNPGVGFLAFLFIGIVFVFTVTGISDAVRRTKDDMDNTKG
ncbi:MAG: hypothetical protein ABIB71_04025 [Candidatus Woesearchaeota archaeon]